MKRFKTSYEYKDSYEDRKRREDFQKFLTIIGIAILTVIFFCARNFTRDLTKFNMWKHGFLSIIILILTDIVVYYFCICNNCFDRFLIAIICTFAIFCIYWHFQLYPKNQMYNSAIMKEKEYWSNLDGWEFEKAVAKAFSSIGYDAEVTKGSNDGGVDIILKKDGMKSIVQCKHYSNPVSIEPIRALWGCMNDFSANQAIFVATSGYTPGCYDFVRNKPNYRLLTLDDIAQMGSKSVQAMYNIYEDNEKFNNAILHILPFYMLLCTIILCFTVFSSPVQNISKNKPYSNTVSTPISNVNTNETYPSCDGNDTLKPMKKERTEQLKPLLEQSEYVFDSDYSLWYRNTTSEGNGYCKSEEMIKNIFWADSNAYIVHPISYKTTYQNGQVVTEHSGFTNLNDLLYNGSVYSGNRKLSSSEIKTLLEKSNNTNNPSNNYSDINAPSYNGNSQTNKSKPYAVPVSNGEPDFRPYMNELQRRIKMNWNPPKGNESKRVVVLMKIAKDGRLLSVNIHESSGVPSIDQAALDAVKLTAPFRPLPAGYSGNSIDIQFTFDYNVNNSNY